MSPFPRPFSHPPARRQRPPWRLLFTILPLLALLLPLGQSGPAASAATGDLTVYGDSLAAGWENWSWDSTVSFAASPAFSGSRAISWRIDRAWGGLYLHSRQDLVVGSSSSVAFALRATQAGQRLTLSLYGAGNGLLGAARPLAQLGGDPPAGAWKRYSIALSQLGAASGARLSGLVLQDANGGPQPAILVDQVVLGSLQSVAPTATPTATAGQATPTSAPPTATATAPPPTATPTSAATATATATPLPPTATPTATPTTGDPALGTVIYDDALAVGWQNWSWGSAVSLGDSTHAYTGSRSIAWQVSQAWGGLYLHLDGGVATSGASAVSLALQASQANQHVALALYNTQNQQIGPAVALADPPVGSWRRYDVSLSSLGAANQLVAGLVLQDQTGAVQPALYVDRIGLVGGATPSPTPTLGPPSGSFRRGVNLAGAEFGETALPGVYGTNYTYPTAAELDYYQAKGLTLIRLPFRWERLQRSLYAALDATELGRLDTFVAAAHARGMKVILDPHNYARYNGQVIGTSAVPNAAFADFWSRVAGHYRDETAVWAYGLVNEPHDTGGLWPAAAQAAVSAIRAVDTGHLILVPGDSWSGAASWPANNGSLNIQDPANNFMYEAHLYFDNDYSGTYDQSYDGEGAYPTIGVDRARPFVDWLAAHNARGFLGEYGVPDTDSRWLTVLDNFLAYLDANGVGGTYWAGGPWWGNYQLSVEPRSGQDRPQTAILTRHLGTTR